MRYSARSRHYFNTKHGENKFPILKQKCQVQTCFIIGNFSMKISFSQKYFVLSPCQPPTLDSLFADVDVQCLPLDDEVAEEVVDIDDLSVSRLSQSWLLFPASPLSTPPAWVGIVLALINISYLESDNKCLKFVFINHQIFHIDIWKQFPDKNTISILNY